MLNKQQRQSFNAFVHKQVSFNYLLYFPDEYNQSQKDFPVLFFLHGIGERGDNLDLLKLYGIPKVIEDGMEIPFLVVSPQCPSDTIWVYELDELHALIMNIIKEYRVDTSRIYLSGLSIGGNGTWHLAAAYPDLFAAVVPVCGWTNEHIGFPERIDVLKDVPVWAFHGEDDDVIPLKGSQELVDVLKTNQGNVKFTTYPNTGHDSWTETYENPRLYEWLLQQKNDNYLIIE